MVRLTYCPLLAVKMIPQVGEQMVVAVRRALRGSYGAMWTSQAHRPYELLCLVIHSQDEAAYW